MKQNITVAIISFIILVTTLGGAYVQGQAQEISKLEQLLSAIDAELGDGNSHGNFVSIVDRLRGLHAESEALRLRLEALESDLAAASDERDQLLQERSQLLVEVSALRQDLETVRKELEQVRRALANAQKTSSTSPAPSSGQGTKVAYLTFDDGPSQNTAMVLDILQAKRVPATFFVIGDDTAFGHQMYRRIVREGHALGNHTYSHNYATIYRSPDAFMRDYRRLDSLLLRVTGVKPTIMRFPGGSTNPQAKRVAGYDVIADIIRQLEGDGIRHYDWNVSADDSLVPAPSAAQIKRNVLENTSGRRTIVVLFHDSKYKDATVEALPEIIDGLRAQGYRFEVLTTTSPRVESRR